VEQCGKLGMNPWTTSLTQVMPLRFARAPWAGVVGFGHAKAKAKNPACFWLVWKGCHAIKSL
jgi:hypothetical protein